MTTLKTSKRVTKDTRATQKNLPENITLLKREILTSSYLVQTLEKRNIPLIDFEDIVDADTELNQETQPVELEEDSLQSIEEMGNEDEDVDFDEWKDDDPFDVEERDVQGFGRYVAQVDFQDGAAKINFKKTPAFRTTKKQQPVREALFSRHRAIKEMALFIAEKQRDYFVEGWKDPELMLEGLNQTDLVEYLQGRGMKLRKEHIARMLTSLHFMVSGLGAVPAIVLFERRGTKVPLTRPKMLDLATQFLKLQKEYRSFTDEAKHFREYITSMEGIEIKLSKKGREEDKYRHLRDILREARKLI